MRNIIKDKTKSGASEFSFRVKKTGVMVVKKRAKTNYFGTSKFYLNIEFFGLKCLLHSKRLKYIYRCN